MFKHFKRPNDQTKNKSHDNDDDELFLNVKSLFISNKFFNRTKNKNEFSVSFSLFCEGGRAKD